MDDRGICIPWIDRMVCFWRKAQRGQTRLNVDEKLKRIANNIPQNAESIDIVKLETNFGASSQRIVSFKDKAGKLIKRFVYHLRIRYTIA